MAVAPTDEKTIPEDEKEIEGVAPGRKELDQSAIGVGQQFIDRGDLRKFTANVLQEADEGFQAAIATRQSLSDISENQGSLGEITISDVKGSLSQLPGGTLIDEKGGVVDRPKGFDSVATRQDEKIGSITRGALGKFTATEQNTFNRGQRNDLDLKFDMDQAVQQHGRQLKQAKSDQSRQRSSLKVLEKDLLVKRRELKSDTTLGARNKRQDELADRRLSLTISKLEADIEQKKQEVGFGRDAINDNILGMDAARQKFNAQRGRGVDDALLEIQAGREQRLESINTRASDIIRGVNDALEPQQKQAEAITNAMQTLVDRMAPKLAKKQVGRGKPFGVGGGPGLLFLETERDDATAILQAMFEANPLDPKLAELGPEFAALQARLGEVNKGMEPAIKRREEVVGAAKDVEQAKADDTSSDEIIQRAGQITQLKTAFPSMAPQIDEAIRSGDFARLDQLTQSLASGEVVSEQEGAVVQ